MGRRSRTSLSLALATTFVVGLVSLSGACGGSDESRVNLVETPDAALSLEGAWGASPCGECVRTACDDERSRCASEPTCARLLDCFEACPAGAAASSPDDACASLCPDAVGPAAQVARDAFNACRVVGPGTRCAACAANGVGTSYRHPLLNQKCAAGRDAGSACLTCALQSCCQTNFACARDQGCTDIANCSAPCTDNACQDKCIRANEASAATFLAQVDCVLTRCSECVPSPSSCTRCLSGPCADERIACDSDKDCASLLLCIRACGVTSETACLGACVRAHPASVSTFVTASVCIQTRCFGCSIL